MRRAGLELTLCALGLFFGAVAGEIYLRFYNPQQLMSPAYEDKNSMRVFTRNAIIKHHYEPYFNVEYHTNSLGFRGPIYGPGKAQDRKRIIVLGPSFSFGIGVAEEQTYARKLERMLNADGKNKYEVMNFGWPGIAINAYEPFYKEVVSNYNPDLLVVHLHFDELSSVSVKHLDKFMGTDGTSSKGAVGLRRLLRLVRYSPGYFFLCENSHLWALLRLQIASAVDQHGIWENKINQVSTLPENGTSSVLQQRWIEMFDSFINTVCVGRKSLRLIVTRDTNEMAHLSLLLNYLRQKSSHDPCFKFLEIDLIPERYTYVGEGHWNPAGHELVAQTISAALK